MARGTRLSVASADRAAFLECGGKRSAAPLFLCSVPRAFRDHLALNAPKDHTGMEKRRRRFALPAQSKMRLGTHDDAIVRLIDLL